MNEDKYSAVWVSHSSMSDFLRCARAYYLKNIYKDPKTGNKIQITSPSLALGQAVHDVLESLSTIPSDMRFSEPLFVKYEKAWSNVSGKRGGFTSDNIESVYRKRGEEMIKRVVKNPGPLKNKAVKIREELPNYWLSQSDNIVLCGKIDWLEYLPESDCVHIIDFKTGKRVEDPESMQLLIYRLLVKNCQKRDASKASYWYLEHSDDPDEKELPDYDEAYEKVLKVAKQMKLARQLERYNCADGGCAACNPFERVLKGDAEYVYSDKARRRDTYFIPDADPDEDESYII